jgi:calcium channel MID1
MAMCRRADRACPAFLGFRCPSRGVTANSSYAVVAEDKDKVSDGQGEGEEDGGVDQWGNRWCNGYELPDGWI